VIVLVTVVGKVGRIHVSQSTRDKLYKDYRMSPQYVTLITYHTVYKALTARWRFDVQRGASEGQGNHGDLLPRGAIDQDSQVPTAVLRREGE